MKKQLSFLIAILLIFLCSYPAVAEITLNVERVIEEDEDETYWDKKMVASFTSTVSLSAKEWYSTSETRALATLLLWSDVSLTLKRTSTSDMKGLLNNPSYVGISSSYRQVVIVFAYDSKTISIVSYTPSTKEISYSEMKVNRELSSNEMDLLMTAVYGSNIKDFSKNDRDDLTYCITQIHDVMQN